jgi:hypothetical protein
MTKKYEIENYKIEIQWDVKPMSTIGYLNGLQIPRKPGNSVRSHMKELCDRLGIKHYETPSGRYDTKDVVKAIIQYIETQKVQ